MAPGYPPAGYPRPKGASRSRSRSCPPTRSAPRPTGHTARRWPSRRCSSPQQESSELTVGTPDANGKTRRSRSGPCGGRSSPGIRQPRRTKPTCASRCRSGRPPPQRSRGLHGRAYGGARDPLDGSRQRHCSRRRQQPGDHGRHPVPRADPCSATASPGVGSTCSVVTTIDAIIGAGAIKEGKRAIWEMGQVTVEDGGPDGVGRVPEHAVRAPGRVRPVGAAQKSRSERPASQRAVRFVRVPGLLLEAGGCECRLRVVSEDVHSRACRRGRFHVPDVGGKVDAGRLPPTVRRINATGSAPAPKAEGSSKGEYRILLTVRHAVRKLHPSSVPGLFDAQAMAGEDLHHQAIFVRDHRFQFVVAGPTWPVLFQQALS